jgi:hypothetical protein
LEALLFLGRALDGARVLCVRLESTARFCAAREEGMRERKEEEEEEDAHGGDGFVTLAESMESVMITTRHDIYYAICELGS